MARSRHPSTGLGRSPPIARRPAPAPTSTPRIVGSGTGDADPPAPQVVLLNPNCSIATAAASVTTARLTPRTRSAEAPAAKPHRRGDRDAADRRRHEREARLVGQVRHGEARHAGERDLHERHLADEAGDDDEREADDHARERDGQRVAVVERQDEQQDDDDDDAQDGRPGQARGAWCLGQPRLDQLATGRQARAAPPQRDDDDQERQHRVDARQRDAAVGREPALRLRVVEERLRDPDQQPDEAGDREGREAREEGRAERRHDLQRHDDRVDLGHGGREDAHPARDGGGEHGVREREPVGREPGEHRAGLALRRGARREAEPRPAVRAPRGSPRRG